MSTRSRRGWRSASSLARGASRVALLIALVAVTATSADAQQSFNFTPRTLDGSDNNPFFSRWGRADVEYRRNAPARYADGIAQPVSGLSPRFVSNRVFDDVAQNLFSENGVTQWGFAWGQFLDHTFGLRELAGGESQPLPFDAADPLEDFRNDFGVIDFTRTPAAPGSGTSTRNPREQINTVDSFIDASAVYGNSAARLDWLRQGSVDGNPANNSALLLLPGGFLPTVAARDDPATAPPTEVGGRLQADPTRAMVAGDFRANENIALTGTHTLFALEHNRIVEALPAGMSEELKFQIARRVVGAEQQYITYTEFLPALGVQLSRYRGYNPFLNPTLSNEFAVVGYRAHSMVHGELESVADVADYTAAELAAIEAQGVEVVIEGDEVEFVIPLNVAFFNPDLLVQLGLGPVMAGLGLEAQYKNDEQIDNQLRSVLFQVPVPGNPGCLDGPTLPECFNGVVDLGAIDIERSRDHGMPSYNRLRQEYGLSASSSFTSITGESTDQFPSDPEIDPADPLNDPDILDFVELRDIDGNVIDPNDEEAVDGEAVVGIRRTTLAARLRAMYGSVSNVDAFVGMLSEEHLPGTEFGELQYRIWQQEFTRLRDGDRFFYANDPVLTQIRNQFGIDYRRTLSQVIVDNTDLEPGDIAANVFEVVPEG
ncbi:MAG: peroxidase family protein [Acidimicrobiales bacterium]